MRHLFGILAFSLLSTTTLLAQVALTTHISPDPNIPTSSWSSLGSAVDGGQDIDLDGVADYVISDPGSDVYSTNGGEVKVFSGINGSLLFSIASPFLTPTRFGAGVKMTPDYTGDGIPDIAISAPDYNTGDGIVIIFSGATGLASITHNAPLAGQSFGAYINIVNDIDGDGIDDLIAASQGAPLGSSGYLVKILSSQPSSPIFVSGIGTFAIARSILGIFDINANGYNDLIVFSSSPLFTGESIYVMDGLTNAPLVTYQITPAFVSGFDIQMIEAIGDLNFDGYSEYLFAGRDSFKVFSLINGVALLLDSSLIPSLSYQKALASIDDITGDSIREIIVQSTTPTIYQPLSFYIYDLTQNTILGQFTGTDLVSFYFGTILPAPYFKVKQFGDVNFDGVKDLVVGYSDYLGTIFYTGSVGINTKGYLVSIQDIANYGYGCFGALSTSSPILSGSALSTAAGNLFSLSLASNQPNTQGVIVLGMATNIPYYYTATSCGAHIDYSLPYVSLTFTTDSSGNWNYQFIVPPGLSGLTSVAQAGVGLTSSPVGTDVSNGLYLHFD